MRKMYFFVMMMFVCGSVFGQVWTYDFGTGTGTANNANSGSGNTAFFTSTPSGGGTYRVRIGSAGGSLVLANPGTSLGTGTEGQLNASTSTSTNKFSVFGWSSPTTAAYLKVKLRSTSSGNGGLLISVGDGGTAIYNDNNSYTNNYNVQLGALLISYSSGTISVQRRISGSFTAISSSGISKDADQLIEIYANNSASTTSYYKSGSNSLNTKSWDLWVDGTKISPSGGYATAGTLAAGTTLNGFAFCAESSASNAATMYIDDLEYSNALPVQPPSVTTDAPSSITTTSATLNGTINANGNSTTTSFDHGTTIGYGTNAAATPSPVTGSTGTAISLSLSPLTVNTQYHYRAKGVNGGGTTNGNDQVFYTLANVPAAPTVNNPTSNSLDVAVNVNSNPSATEFAIHETSTGNYVQAGGALGATAVWQTAATWATKTVTGLTPSTTYTFEVKARNGDNTETAFSSTASGTTTTSGSPYLSATTLSGFGNVCLSVTGGPNMFTLSGGNLDGSDVTVGPLAGYTFSTSAGGSYTSSLLLLAYSGANTDIYVKFAPVAVQSYSGNIPTSGGGIVNYDIAVTGSGINTAPIVTTGSVSGTTQISTTAAGSITSIGCSAIGSSYGIEYSTSLGFTPGTGTQVVASNLSGGNFSVLLSGLTASTTYYYRAYASNSNPAASYGNELSFATPGVTAPVATAATAPFTYNSFTANWNASVGATGYRLDASTSPTFGTTPVATDLFISEYMEGSSNNKYIEIYNGTGASVNLTNYKLQLYANGGSITQDIVLSGTLTNGSTVVYKNSGATIFGGTATTNNAINYNGDDAVALFKISTSSFVDIIGTIGEDPGIEWSAPGGYSTLDKTLRRKSTVIGGVTVNPGAGFPTLATEWDVFPIDNVADLGAHTFNPFAPSFLSGYNNLSVAGTSQSVTTPAPGSGTFYYRVRAVDGSTTSSNSNVITVVMNDQATSAFRSAASGNYNNGSTWEFNVSPPLYYAVATQGPTSSNDVTIQNSNTVTLTANGAANNLTLGATGNIVLGTNNLVVNSTAGGSFTGYIKTDGIGALTVNNITTAKTLPIGNAKYNPLIIENGSGHNWTAKVADGVTPDPGFSDDKAVLVTWNITPSVNPPAAGANITFQFDEAPTPAGQTGINFSAAENVQGWHRYLGAWIPAGTPMPVLGSAGASTVKLTGLTAFSDYALSNISGPLPVTFGNIKAFQQGTGIKVNWTNFTESDMMSYQVEHSANGQNFDLLSIVNPTINNGSRADYSYFDAAPISGNNFYRIRSLEVTGRILYSVIVKVNTKANGENITLYPNPLTGSLLSLQTTGLPKGQYKLNVYAANGQQVFTQVVQLNGGSATEVVQLPLALKPGMYSLQIGDGNVNRTKTFIIQ